MLNFVSTGGSSLQAYDEFQKLEWENGHYKVTNRRVAYRHRLSIGTIVSDTAIQIRYLNGQYIGTIEEYFISRLSPGDVFWFAGRNLELVRIRDMTAQVRNSKRKSGAVPSWQGGRMPLSAQMSVMLRKKIDQLSRPGLFDDPELTFIQPFMEALETDELSAENLWSDIQASINSVEMARRRFRDIASIAGLVFKGYPGKPVKDRHLQSNSQLFFDVFHDYESDNLLLLQAYEEVMDFQLEEARLRAALNRINKQRFVVMTPDRPTPFAFPIMVDRLSRDRLSTEKIEDRIKRMQLQYED